MLYNAVEHGCADINKYSNNLISKSFCFKIMKFKELLDFIEFENNRAISHSKHIKNRERPYVRTVKLMEEVGELCNEIIAYGNHQRKEKQAFNKTNLEDLNEYSTEINKVVRKAMGNDTKIKYNIVDEIKPSPSGKYMYTFSRVKD